MAIALKVGGEVEAACTSCRRDTVHRIVALLEGKPKKVECLSCKKTHQFRATEAQKEAEAAHKRASKGDTGPAPAKKPSRARAGSAPIRRREDDDAATWEKSIAGKANDNFKRYGIDQTFSRGDLVKHAKFGDGVVIETEINKAVIVFKEGRKILAQSLVLA